MGVLKDFYGLKPCQGKLLKGEAMGSSSNSSLWPWIMYVLNLEEYDLLVTGVYSYNTETVCDAIIACHSK